MRFPEISGGGRIFRGLLVVVLASPAAGADSAFRVALDYATDPALSGCPDEPAFRRLVRDHLGYDPFDASSRHAVVARARVEEQGLRGSVEWRDASGSSQGERELRSQNHDCAELVKLLSFTMAVQIQLLADDADNDAAVAADARLPAAPPAPTPAPEAGAREPAGEPGPEAASRGLEWLLGAGPAAGFGIGPAVAAEGRVFLAVRGERAALELGGEASLATRRATADGNAVEQQLFLGSLAGCVVLPPFAGCLVSKLGELQIEGIGVDTPRSPSGLLALLGPRLALGTDLGPRWAGALRLELLATLSPWTVTLNEREVWRSPPLSVTLGADIAAIFRNNPTGQPAIP